jgi:hypothetical protein
MQIHYWCAALTDYAVNNKLLDFPESSIPQITVRYGNNGENRYTNLRENTFNCDSKQSKHSKIFVFLRINEILG